ncbi:MAG: hypothetical protein Q9170_001238 [Blastenia crenularia]
MISIQRPNLKGPPSECTPNLLPCRIHHDGPVNASERYWAPKPSEDGTFESYFRGRKLKAREVKIPEGYRGVVVKEKATESDKQEDRMLSERLRGREGEEAMEDDEEEEEITIMEEVGEFGEIMVWGHESVAQGDDTFIRSLEEWIDFADAMHRPGLEERDREKKPS